MIFRLGWTVTGGRTHALHEQPDGRWVPLCCASPLDVYHVGDPCDANAPTCSACRLVAARGSPPQVKRT